jgi:mitogen-activated protein kinase kinase
MDESEREKTEKRILRELKILKICKSPYIVEFHGAFAHEGDISICMEFMDLGSLDYIYKKTGPIPEDIISKITVPCLKGLQCMFFFLSLLLCANEVYSMCLNFKILRLDLYNTHKIVHRDIKPSNILLNAAGEIKIADFGVSKELVNGTMAKTFTGTQGYLAPERVREGRIHSVESDVYSLGLTLMELATARFPFPPEGHPPLPSVIDLLRYIEEEPSPTLPEGRFSEEFNDFTQQW